MKKYCSLSLTNTIRIQSFAIRRISGFRKFEAELGNQESLSIEDEAKSNVHKLNSQGGLRRK